MAACRANNSDGLELGRRMLAEDNPGELWIERGKKLFSEQRGPKNVSLERATSGSGPASSKARSRGFRATSATRIACRISNRGC